jgi:AcrR family transcriptional regulator
MAEIARRAGVGMAALYRSFPGRQELLEGLYVEEVAELAQGRAAPFSRTVVAFDAIYSLPTSV